MKGKLSAIANLRYPSLLIIIEKQRKKRRKGKTEKGDPSIFSHLLRQPYVSFANAVRHDPVFPDNRKQSKLFPLSVHHFPRRMVDDGTNSVDSSLLLALLDTDRSCIAVVWYDYANASCVVVCKLCFVDNIPEDVNSRKEMHLRKRLLTMFTLKGLACGPFRHWVLVLLQHVL